jgi:hypothetical protein
MNPPNLLRLIPIRIGSNQTICAESVHEDVTLEVLEGWGLLAIQGPRASQVLQSLVTNIDLQKELTFGHSAWVDFPALGEEGKLHVARGGYTGEDGFEVSAICPAPCRQYHQHRPILLPVRTDQSTDYRRCFLHPDLRPTQPNDPPRHPPARSPIQGSPTRRPRRTRLAQDRSRNVSVRQRSVGGRMWS